LQAYDNIGNARFAAVEKAHILDFDPNIRHCLSM
jgi:hypothetical protein